MTDDRAWHSPNYHKSRLPERQPGELHAHAAELASLTMIVGFLEVVSNRSNRISVPVARPGGDATRFGIAVRLASVQESE